MDLYAADSAVAEWAETPAAALAAAGLDLLIEQAWYLRQRQPARAAELAALARELLAEPVAANLAGRLILIEAEHLWLAARFAEAAAAGDRAQQAFEAASDWAGVGDARLLLGQIAQECGESAAAQAYYDNAATAYARADDAQRVAIAGLWSARLTAFSDPHTAERLRAELLATLPPDIQATSAAIGALDSAVQGAVHMMTGQSAQAALRFAEAAEQAQLMGMVWLAGLASINVGVALANLGDHEGASEWLDQALEMAQPLRWPSLLGGCLVQLGRQLYFLGHYDRSYALLTEGAEELTRLPHSRLRAANCLYLGDCALKLDMAESAVGNFTEARQIALALGQQEVVITAMGGQARALSLLGAHDEALQLAAAAWQQVDAARLPIWQIQTLRALAEIRHAHPAATVQAGALTDLESALAIANTVGGYIAEGELLAELSQAHERAGDLGRALDYERRARIWHERTANDRAAKRAVTAQIRHDTARIALAAEQHRLLAAAEARRAAALEDTRQTLERLGRIGQEITANLDTDAVLQVMQQHVVELLDAPFVAVLLLDPSGQALIRHGLEDGRPVAVRRVALDSPSSNSARCLRERREILVEAVPESAGPANLPGTRPMLTALFAPLVVGERALGVMSIQSANEHAYGERERLIFRTLCAYGAVALANAEAYRKLGDALGRLEATQNELRRLAATDSLTELANRRHFFDLALRELARSIRTARPLGFVMVDIDNFKAINDQHGHPAGDAAIVAVARLLVATARAGDLVGRLGGEEFGVLLPEANEATTMMVAERLRAAVASTRIRWAEGELAVTLSAGCVAAVPDIGTTLDELIRNADIALYDAKRRGRNRVCAWRKGDCVDVPPVAGH